MRRLIDANALNWGRCPTDGKLAKAWLDDAPTVDAVEVVRCKDCKQFIPFPYHNAGQCRKMVGLMSGNDFCSYGERREGE